MNGNAQSASIEFEKAVKENPADDNILYLLARLKAKEGNLKIALEMLKKATDIGSMLVCGNELYFGGRTYDLLYKDPLLERLQKESAFKQMMNHYFPEKTNNFSK